MIMLDARNVSMRGSGITGHNGIGSRYKPAGGRRTAADRLRVAAYAALARGDDADQ
jgi:hypothetical protein